MSSHTTSGKRSLASLKSECRFVCHVDVDVWIDDCSDGGCGGDGAMVRGYHIRNVQLSDPLCKNMRHARPWVRVSFIIPISFSVLTLSLQICPFISTNNAAAHQIQNVTVGEMVCEMIWDNVGFAGLKE